VVILSVPAVAVRHGFLQANEVIDLRLKADLVLLSACDTAVRKLLGEDGIANLARSFLATGTQTVVSTLWEGDDAFASTLIRKFYAYLGRGQSASIAMANAKREMIRTFGKVSIDLPASKSKDRPPLIEPKAVASRYLGDGIGYLRVSYFPGAVGYGFIRHLEEGLRSLQDACARRFVLDLRGNPGGGLGSLRLMSLLSSAPKPIGYSLTRRAIRRGLNKEDLPKIDRIPKGKLEQIGMAIRFKVLNRARSTVLATERLARSVLVGKTVLLVNDYTKSAAEMVVAFCKEHNLATIVGQRTPGEVLGAVNFKLLDGYRLRMPIATWHTWAGEIVEGKGISPNIEADLSPDGLTDGADSQLQRAIEVCRTI
jgi:hypothetical protein